MSIISEVKNKNRDWWNESELTLACRAICLTSRGRFRSDTIFATLVSTKPSRSEKQQTMLQKHYVNTHFLYKLILWFHNHLCGTAASPDYSHSPEALSQLQQSWTDPTWIQQNKITRSTKEGHKVDCAFEGRAWTRNETYSTCSLSHLNSTQFIFLARVIVNHHDEVVADVSFLIAAALVTLSVRHESGYVENSYRTMKTRALVIRSTIHLNHPQNTRNLQSSDMEKSHFRAQNNRVAMYEIMQTSIQQKCL